MFVATGILKFKIESCFSLKEKRGIVRPIIARLQREFNISMAEVGSLDKYQITEVGFSMVSNDKKVLNKKVDKLFNMAEELGLAELFETEYDIYSF